MKTYSLNYSRGYDWQIVIPKILNSEELRAVIKFLKDRDCSISFDNIEQDYQIIKVENCEIEDYSDDLRAIKHCKTIVTIIN